MWLQVYPTHARNFGAAVADGWGRIGGFASPFAVGEHRPVHMLHHECLHPIV